MVSTQEQTGGQDLKVSPPGNGRFFSAGYSPELYLGATPYLLLGLDLAQKVVLWNRTAEEVFQLRAAAVLDRRLMTLSIDWDWQRVLDGLRLCGQDRDVIRLDDVKYVRTSGAEGSLSLKVCPVASGEVLSGFLISGAESSEMKMVQAQLAHAHKLESIGQLAAGIAHEINTPTQFVGDNARFLRTAFKKLESMLSSYGNLLAQVLKTAPDSEPAHQAQADFNKLGLKFLLEEIPGSLDDMIEGVARISEIVQAMKQYAHPGDAEKTPIDLNEALQNTVTVARSEWRHHAEIDLDLDPELPLVPCFPGEISQVFLNVIVNAAQAIAAGPKGEKGLISITTRKHGGHALIRIADNGPGVDLNHLDKLFDPFFTTKAPGMGTGQGLAISHSVVVNRHNGKIRIDPDHQQGAAFEICLPLAD